MLIHKIDDEFAVSAQIERADIAELKEQGFATIMCNRPDDEEHAQPAFSDIAQAAEADGLHAIHLPVISGAITPDDVAAFKAAFETAPKPVFAYCRSGARCQMLYQLSTANG